MKKTPFLFLSLLAASLSVQAQGQTQPVVNEQCVTNLIVMEETSSEIAHDSKWLLRLIDEHFWVGAENRKDLIAEVNKYHTDYKSNFDYIFNNKKKTIINDQLKQDCIVKTEEKIKAAHDVLKEVRIMKTALLLTIANTSNIMKKNSCNVEETCAKELNDDFMSRIKAAKDLELKKEEMIKEKLEKEASKKASKSQASVKHTKIKNKKNISIIEDDRICY